MRSRHGASWVVSEDIRMVGKSGSVQVDQDLARTWLREVEVDDLGGDLAGAVVDHGLVLGWERSHVGDVSTRFCCFYKGEMPMIERRIGQQHSRGEVEMRGRESSRPSYLSGTAAKISEIAAQRGSAQNLETENYARHSASSEMCIVPRAATRSNGVYFNALIFIK